MTPDDLCDDCEMPFGDCTCDWVCDRCVMTIDKGEEYWITPGGEQYCGPCVAIVNPAISQRMVR